MPNSLNRRNFTRILCDAKATACQDERCWQVQLLDISLRGLLAETPVNFDADRDQSFALSIILGDEEICMSAHLRHENPRRIGFECDYIDLESAQVLRRLVEINLGDESLIHRELGALGEPE